MFNQTLILFLFISNHYLAVESFHFVKLTSKYPPVRLDRPHVGGLVCRVTPISRKVIRKIVPKSITIAQYGSYWGINSIERVQRIFESVIVAYGGAWLAWFASFMIGSLLSTIMGCGLVFNWVYAPWLNARKRNSKIWPKSVKLHYAEFSGRITSLTRLRRRAGKMIGAVSQEYLQLVVSDEDDRKLEVITQWQDSYSTLRLHMKCECVIASPKRDFSELFTVTELWVPSCDCYVGDYPYLNRKNFESLVYSIEAIQLTGVDDGDDTRRKPASLQNIQNMPQSRVYMSADKND